MKAKPMILCALFAAITAVCAQLSIPTAPVPFSLSVMAVFLTGALLGKKYALISQLVYLLIGAVGAPVFAGFRGGISVLAGPTGGYLFVFPVMAFLIALITEKLGKKNMLTLILAMGVALAACYACGSFYLAFTAQMTVAEAFAAGCVPFIAFDIIKIAASALLALAILKAARKQKDMVLC